MLLNNYIDRNFLIFNFIACLKFVQNCLYVIISCQTKRLYLKPNKKYNTFPLPAGPITSCAYLILCVSLFL